MAALWDLVIGVAAGMAPAAPAPLAMPLLAVARDARPSEQQGQGPAMHDDAPAGSAHRPEFTIERRIILRIPMLQRAPQLPDGARVMPYAQRKSDTHAPSCVALNAMRGAAIDEGAGVVFIMRSSNRYRAVLERGCRPVDFQSGFYVNSTADGAICAGRDMLHARNGTACVVRAFARLP